MNAFFKLDLRDLCVMLDGAESSPAETSALLVKELLSFLSDIEQDWLKIELMAHIDVFMMLSGKNCTEPEVAMALESLSEWAGEEVYRHIDGRQVPNKKCEIIWE
ncbi:hypothetical protein [Neptuniibacter sp. QD37_11]|uniref:hypothetical protein n=1 Tax=Neptuniibacter sp. QD37_11 TaxID=3398209 RepID=UPI0039F4B678